MQYMEAKPEGYRSFYALNQVELPYYSWTHRKNVTESPTFYYGADTPAFLNLDEGVSP